MQARTLEEAIVLNLSKEVDTPTCRLLQDAVAVAETCKANFVVVFDSSIELDALTVGVLCATTAVLGDRLWIVASVDSNLSRLLRNDFVTGHIQVVASLDAIERMGPERRLDRDDAWSAEGRAISHGWGSNKLANTRRL